MEYGETAIEKLEEVLNAFHEAREQILLWWRPNRLIKEALGLLSESLLSKYLSIADTYQKAGWGIFDASDDEEYVEELLNAYYGEMNARVGRLKGKIPIMIESVSN